MNNENEYNEINFGRFIIKTSSVRYAIFFLPVKKVKKQI